MFTPEEYTRSMRRHVQAVWGKALTAGRLKEAMDEDRYKINGKPVTVKQCAALIKRIGGGKLKA